MTLADRLKALRRELGLSQEALGAQGFVSTPGWVKIENGQRSPSETLLKAFVDWLVRERRVPAKHRAPLLDELLTLKYLADPSPFVRAAVRFHALGSGDGIKTAGRQLLAAFDAATRERAKPRRGRPPGAVYRRKAARA